MVPLFGREDQLRQVLEHAARSRAGVVGLAGPAGIGKSRLAAEVLERLRDNGFRTLHGSGGPLHRDLSYAPVVAALRPLMSHTRLHDGLGVLGRLFDGLSLPRPESLGDRSFERTRLFEAVCTLLRRVQEPLVLHLDDLHWVDSESLALLHYLVRGLADRRVLFLLSYRPGECSRDADAVLNALRHADQLTDITLGPLDDTSVRELAEALLGAAPPAGLLDLLSGRAAGVPLFVRALVDGLRAEGALTTSAGRWVLRGGRIAPVPDIVADLLRDRIETLDDAARAVLDAIAVAGGHVTHAVLAQSGTDEAAVLDGVRRLRGAGLVEEELVAGTVKYRAAYPLLSEVAYGLIPAAARGARHATAARAVARTAPADLRTLAFHLRNAGDAVPAEHAFDVLSTAARAAFAARRGEEAAANARAAIHAAARLGADTGTELHELLAEASELAAHMDDALAAWLTTADLPGATPATQARCLISAAMAEWDLGRPHAGQAHLDRATAALAGEQPGPEHLAMTTTGLRWAMRRGDAAAQSEWLDELDRLVAVTGSPRAQVTRDVVRVTLDLEEGRFAHAITGIEAAVDAAQRFGDPQIIEWVHRPVFAILVGCGNLDAARRHADTGLRGAEASGVPLLGIFPRVCLAFVDFFEGHWDEALARSFDALELCERLGSPRGSALTMVMQGLLLARRGRFAEALRRVADARAYFGSWSTVDRHVFSLVEQVEIEVALGRGDDAGAAAGALAAADRNPLFLPVALNTLGDTALRVGDTATARSAADRLDELDVPYPRALAQRVRGRLAGDPAVLADAAKALGAVGMVYDEMLTRLDRADLGAAEPAELDHCVQVLDRLRARPQADRARSLLRALGERPTPHVEPGRVPALSGREEQVARLVAEGLSNAEVATRLFISPRTVTTHLQNIYGRLGLGSRTALARYVMERLPADT